MFCDLQITDTVAGATYISPSLTDDGTLADVLRRLATEVENLGGAGMERHDYTGVVLTLKKAE